MSLALRLIDETAAHAIVDGDCPPGYRCPDDYPAEGDRVAAGLFLQRLAAGLDPRPFGAFLVVVGDIDEVIVGEIDEVIVGGAGFHGGVDDRGRVEIGYGIAPSQRGRGYATRALGLLIELARELGATTLLAETDHDNPASQAVLAHHGFTRSSIDGHAIRFDRPLGSG